MDFSKNSKKENTFNIETSSTINSIKSENKNTIENTESNSAKKNSKLSQLMNENNYLSKMLKNKFNKWKILTFSKRKNLGSKSRKILIKKTLNIHRAKDNQELYQKEKQKIKILKKIKDINLNEEEEDKRKKVIKFFESRILSYQSWKDIVKKYYEIWKTKALNNEEINENIITKKIITKIKFNNKTIEQKENMSNEKYKKLKNIIFKYKNPLKIYFNISKTKVKCLKSETCEKEIVIKTIEKEQPSMKIKIKKKVSKKQKKLKSQRKKNLTILISKDYLKNRNNEVLKKYFKKWISRINENQNIIKDDNPIETINEISDNNNIINIENTKNENDIKFKDEIKDNKDNEKLSDKKDNKEKNTINKVVIKKNIIKDPIKNIKQNQYNNDLTKNPKEDTINLVQKEKENNKSIPEISNNEFMLYKIFRENLLNIDKNKEDKDKEKEKEMDNKKIKLKKIIENNNKLKSYFNKWKHFLIKIYDDETKEKNKNNKFEAEEENKMDVFSTKKENEQPTDRQDLEKNKNKKENLKIINIIKNRMLNYMSQKQIIRKYFDRWQSQIPPTIIKQSLVNKIIIKKMFSSKKKKKISDNESTDIQNIKKNLFGKENEIENNVKMQIYKKSKPEKKVINNDLYEKDNINKGNTVELPDEKNDDEFLKNNILNLSLGIKDSEISNEIQQPNCDNNYLKEEKKEIISDSKEKNLSEKSKKLENIIKNQTQFKYFFNKWKKFIYLKTLGKNDTENMKEIIEPHNNKKNFEILGNIIDKIMMMEYFLLLKNIKIKHEIDKNKINLEKNKINHLETSNIEKKDEKDKKIILNKNDMILKDILDKPEAKIDNENKKDEYNIEKETGKLENKILFQKNLTHNQNDNCNNKKKNENKE